MTKKPIRVFEGNAKPHEAFWRVVDAAASDSGEPEIEFYGVISEYSWWDDDITPAKFKEDLNKIGKGGPVTVRINSPGGEAWAASVIRSIIMEYKGKVTVRIDGLCASAATIVATAGDRVLMQDSAFFMIHEAWLFAMGNIEDLKKAIDFLKTTNQGLIEAYQSKTNLSAEQLAKMMNETTWMTARQAQEYGFIDEIITGSGKTFDLAGGQAAWNLLNEFENVPAGLIQPGPVAEATESQPSPADGQATDPIKREEQSLRDYLDIFA